jgi:hypothetical protein
LFATSQRCLSCLTLAGVLASGWLTSTAWANGRFPRAERLSEDPSSSSRLVLSATYGLLLTNDRGQNWSYLCEKAFSLQDSYLGDPLFAWSGDGTQLVGVQSSLNLSHDEACTWTSSLGGGLGQLVIDFALAGGGSTVVALVDAYQDGGVVHQLQESTDNGSTWRPIGIPLPVLTAYTVDVDASDGAHIFVTAASPDGQGSFLVSTTHGASWQSYPIPGTSADEPPYIALIHPGDANKIYVRTDSWLLTDGNEVGNDALFYSSDGGLTWSEEFRASAKLLGVALSPGGDTLLLGYGDPKTEPFVVDETAMGIYASPSDAFQFARIYDGAITCLTWTPSGIYACTSQVDVGYALGFVPNLDALATTGDGFSPLLRLSEIKGPLACCGGAATLVCGAVWPTACGVFGACADGGVSLPVCTVDDGGTDRADAAAPLGDGASDTRSSVGSDGGLAPKSGSACSCHLSDGRPNGKGPFYSALLALLVWLPRRRVQSSKAQSTTL